LNNIHKFGYELPPVLGIVCISENHQCPIITHRHIIIYVRCFILWNLYVKQKRFEWGRDITKITSKM